MPQNRKKNKHNNSYRCDKKHRTVSRRNEQNGVNDDIMMQLEIQRSKQRENEKQTLKYTGSPQKRSTCIGETMPKAKIGNFYYDDARKAYFPRGTFERKIAAKEVLPNIPVDALKSDDVQNVCKSILFSQRQRQLFERNRLRFSGLECSLISRANLVFNSRKFGDRNFSLIPPMMGAMDEMYHGCTDSYLDCLCKELILHPSARSFDVSLQYLPMSLFGKYNDLPHIATIIGETSNNLCLRPQQPIRNFDLSSPLGSENESILFNLPHEPDTFCKSVRFPHTSEHKLNGDNFQLGVLARESRNEKSCFYVIMGSSDGLKTCRWSDMEISGDVNDFCFLGSSNGKKFTMSQ